MIDTNTVSDTTQRAGCVLEDSEIVGLNAAVAPVRSSSFQWTDSKGFIALPCTLSTDINERYNLGFGECGSLVLLLRLVVPKGRLKSTTMTVLFVLVKKMTLIDLEAGTDQGTAVWSPPVPLNR